MKIYFSPWYSTHPYIDYTSSEHFGTICCGPAGLLSLLQLHAGIHHPKVSKQERQIHYHNHMAKMIRAEHLFYPSFCIDSLGVSNKILQWRDILVSAGWNLQDGGTPKLRFIKDMEPENLPKGEADQWYEILQLAQTSSLLPTNSELFITTSAKALPPMYTALFGAMRQQGTPITEQWIAEPIAEGNLQKLQEALLSNSTQSIVLPQVDDTFEILHFQNEDAAYQYIATQPTDHWGVYLCSNLKRFDNTLHLLRQPVCGSSLDGAEPQVVQLFKLGNGLFDYPLNVQRIISWLTTPINPLKKFRHKLAMAIVSSGGIKNDEWNTAVEKYLETLKDTQSQQKAQEELNKFLPLPTSEAIDILEVRSFNQALEQWAAGILSMDKFPYDPIIHEQLQQLCIYCQAMLQLLQGLPGTTISPLTLQNWCQHITSPGSYPHCDAEAHCRSAITTPGNMHSTTDSLIWINMQYEPVAYSFDFLTTQEVTELKNCGVLIPDLDQEIRSRHYEQLLPILKTKRLTIVELKRAKNDNQVRHPLFLRIQEQVKDGLGRFVRHPEIPEQCMQADVMINNHSEAPFTELEPAVELQSRGEKEKTESYSSLDLLVQYPFDYVCNYCANLKDQAGLSLEDTARIMGNVAHKLIEKIFNNPNNKLPEIIATDKSKQTYNQLFDKTIDECGLVLRLPEHHLALENMRDRMSNGVARLALLIRKNSLTVDPSGCEYNLDTCRWPEAEEKATLGARVDMLLTARDGSKVIFDLKWSDKPKRFAQLISENRALQLALYEYVAQKQFNTPIRTAYILMPKMILISGHAFEDTPAIEHPSINIMQQLANSYQYRWEQLHNRQIERSEELPMEEIPYTQASMINDLFPLKEYRGVKSSNPYTDYSKLR